MKQKPKVSAIIVTYNRPRLLPHAIQSVLDQTFQDFELIVVDNGLEQPAEKIVKSFNDKRIKYIKNDRNTGCAGGKNIGIKNAEGEYVAFLDDDDIWLSEKLELQVKAFENVPKDVAFCFTAATIIFDDREINTTVPNGIADYYERTLQEFSGFLSVTRMIKKPVFGDIGFLNENFPSHTDVELIIRIAKKYRGIGINKPLVNVNHLSSHQQMGSSYKRRIAGRNMVLAKYRSEFKKRPRVLAKHLFKLAKFYRNDGQYCKAREIFKKSYKLSFKIRIFVYYLSMFFNGLGYKLFRLAKLKPLPQTQNLES